MHLRIMSQEADALNAEAEHVVLPGAGGEMDVWSGHAALISVLREGDIIYFYGNSSEHVKIPGGLVEINDDTITVLLN